MSGRRGRFPEEIELQVEGPSSILPTTFTGKAKLNETWSQFLARNGHKLTPADKIVVRTYNGYKACDKKPGWTAELNEPLKQFIHKFTRAKQRYCVKLVLKERLRSPHIPQPSQGQGDILRLRGAYVPLTRTPINLQGRQPLKNPEQQSTLVYRTTTTTATTTPNKSTPRQPRRRQGPSFVIPTARGGGGPSAPENFYGKPRYTPGIINGSPRGSTQNRYGTRLKGLINKQNVSGGGGVRVKQKAGVGRSMGPPPPKNGSMPRGCGGRQGDLSNSLVRIKVERVEEEEEEGSNVIGGRGDLGGGANEDEEDTSDPSDSDSDMEGDGGDEDNLSFITGVTAERRELRREGIQVEDVKTRATERLSEFNNSYYLRMQKEIKDLRKSGHWVKNVNKAPLACYLLQEMFKC